MRSKIRRLSRQIAVITGFNTDIEYNGVTYHVQTEDKGVNTPLILSLVYDRGTILASKRSPYDDLLKGGLDEKQLAERLQKQHHLICAAIKAGRIEDLRRMTMKESASKKKGLIAQKEIKVPVAEKTDAKREEIPMPDLLAKSAAQFEPDFDPLQLQVKPDSLRGEEAIFEIPISILEEPIIEAVEIVEEETILPIDAVEIITDFTKAESHEEEKLRIELLNSPTFKGGERKTLSILVHRGQEETGTGGAHVMVKVLGSAFRPLIFHAKTDSNGIAIVHLQLPSFKQGRAAVLVRAMTGGEEVELRRVIQHN
ncbi:MAG TPA: hypothetical protein VK400_10305 [Pyrinomonadaceae bacterium]|nr:hypothetical protein [Pyrinomonadaceae bacterium]